MVTSVKIDPRFAMDFLDPSKKRIHSRRLLIGYVLIGIAILLVTRFLLLSAYGFGVDRKTGQIIQNGLVFLSAHPESAAIYINGTQNSSRTDTKLSLPAGHYSIELKRDKYRSWKHELSLDGGNVEQLVYPVLFPEKLVTSDVQLYGSPPAFATASPDRHWLLVLQPGSLVKFDNFDMNNVNQAPTTLTVPDGILTSATGDQSLSLAEWSTDNRHVMLKHTYNGTYEYIMVDRETPNLSFNVNKLIGSTPTQVTLRDKSADKLYVYDTTAQTLQSFDVKSKQITPLLTKVLAYKSHGADMILYASSDGGTVGKNGVRLWDGKNNYLINSYPVATNFLLDIAQFGGDWYMVVGLQQEGRVTIYKNPQDTLKQPNHGVPTALLLRIDDPQFVSFSDNARFIAAQSGSKFAIYDAETDRRFYYQLKNDVPPTQQAVWMDGHRLLLVLNSKTEVFDFDGTNQQTLSPSYPGFIPYFDRDYTGLYNIAPSVQVAGRGALTRTELKVKN